MTKKPDLITVTAVNLFEAIYAGQPDPEAAIWPRYIVMAGLSLCDNSWSRRDRFYRITGNMIRTLAPERQAALAQEVSIPADVQAIIAGDEPWPAPLDIADFDDGAGLDLDAYKAVKITSLRTGINAMANEVIKGGDRIVLTMVFQALEADAWLAAEESGGDLPDAPHVHAYAVGKGITAAEAAVAIKARVDGWSAANAALETARVQAGVTIGAATTLEEVDTAYDTAMATARATVDAVLAASQG